MRVRKILRERPEWEVIGEACDGFEVVQKAQELQPDVVLLDIGMPMLNGLLAAVKIRRAAPATKIVFLTEDSDVELRSAALAIGVEGYVLKIKAPTDLLPTVSTAIRNGLHPN